MIRKYSLIVESDGGNYSAYVPELPTILVTAESFDQLTQRAAEALRIYLECARPERSPDSILHEIEVEVMA